MNQKNQKERYNQIWGCGNVIEPEKWSAWEIVKDFQETTNLEIGPGNYPKIPIEKGYFLDISENAIKNLEELGGKGFVGDAIDLPFENNFFDLVVAIEVLEHIEDDKKALAEISRTLKPAGNFLFSVPLKQELYSEVDQIVGHIRRYKIKKLIELLETTGFRILKYRHPSFYLQMIDRGASFLRLTKLIYKNQAHNHFFYSPKFMVNFYGKSAAFLERKGAPKWRKDIENLSNYKEKAIVLFCQKI